MVANHLIVDILLEVARLILQSVVLMVMILTTFSHLPHALKFEEMDMLQAARFEMMEIRVTVIHAVQTDKHHLSSILLSVI